jgi:pimeloyl-ACP methyl ester carboxylesterase
VFVHGNPSHSEDWQPFLDRIDGPALAFDLPGWGRSERPSPADFDYSMYGLAKFTTRFLQRMAVEDHSLVVHDWGSLALIGAQEEPDRVRRLVVINAVTLLPGYRWHRTARVWRTRGLGELSNKIWSRRVLDLGLRESRGDWSRHDPEFIDMIWDHLDGGTFDAVLRLYRSAPPDALAAAGERLDGIKAPALVVWGGTYAGGVHPTIAGVIIAMVMWAARQVEHATEGFDFSGITAALDMTIWEPASATGIEARSARRTTVRAASSRAPASRNSLRTSWVFMAA